MLRIETIKEKDLEKAAVLSVSNWKETYRGLLDPEFLDDLSAGRVIEKWMRHREEGEWTMLAAYEGETFLGFGAFMPDSEIDSCLYLDSLHVSREARGKGVGTGLIAQIGKEAAKAGYQKMSICIVKGNDTAGNLYRKLGARHEKDFVDDLGGVLSNSEKMVWDDLTPLVCLRG